MKKLILLTVVALAAASQAGCSTCRESRGSGCGSWFSGWFNQGDECGDMAQGCPPGMPRATMMVPTSPQMLPGPIEIAPAN